MNDEERFTALFRRHHAQVLAYALRRTDTARAEDVVAETFAAAWRHIGKLSEEPLPWLYRTAWNCLANERRSNARQVRVAGRVAAEGEGVVADHAAGVAENAELMAALGKLPARDREALLLVSWEGLDQRSAASALGCSVAAFKVRLHRARKKLAALLAVHEAVQEA
ncbi:RNA polymerase sigma factor [Actinomadura rudentiformis]|uniref:RNA polymerase sigma factor n=1 Tax=Actinomadura rudentiformis TaxID=359158 RepID=UPI00178C31C8|nr:RNA polymerase sigma factor [Actinomadura rudentiformis]